MRQLIILITLCLTIPLVLSSPIDIQEYTNYLASYNKRRVADKRLNNKGLIIKTYANNNNQLIWPDRYIPEALDILKNSKKDGLYPIDYHYYRLHELITKYNKSGYDKNKIRAEIDILLTDGIYSYAFHLANGKVSPQYLHKYWNYQENHYEARNAINRLKASIRNQTLQADIASLRPQFIWYKKLRSSLERYENLARSYSNIQIPNHGMIRPGTRSNSMPQIAKKLNELGLLDRASFFDPTLYNSTIVGAVKKYQERHSLKSDGVIGARTIANLNISYQQRADQIRANLERARWVADDLTNNYLLVNIAGYKLTYFKNKRDQWSTKVVVGTQGHKTPVFTSKLKYIEYNPTWTVPKSMRPAIVQRAKNDPSYLSSRGYKLKTAQGKTVNAANINWGAQDPNNFKYWLVRSPKGGNPLGRVKFMFPNSHAIYMHDTPSKHLFNKEHRSFSHGCIRIEHPLELSLMLLSEDQGFTLSRQDDILATGKTTDIYLKKPIDVFVMYWTAAPEEDGMHFYDDIYHRDQQLIELLKTPTEELLLDEGKQKLVQSLK
ncbi:MAG: L,D-transpeptidase family protein [Cellvibrionales bacterium]|nr:L,D-transpeptidase family protein [Cellvibrionales bacterium]